MAEGRPRAMNVPLPVRWLACGTLALCLLAACGVAGGAAWWLGRPAPPTRTRQPTPTLAEIEHVARLRLPPIARNAQAEIVGFQDRIIRLRFEMDPADLQPFLATTFLAPPLSTATNPFSLAAGGGALPAWWTPWRAQHFQAGRATVGGVTQAILIDTADAQIHVVYVETGES